MELNGVEWSWSGVEWSGMEWSEMDENLVDVNGREARG